MRWIMGGGIGLALAVGAACRRVDSGPPLPALKDYEDLPAAFAEELLKRREEVIAASYEPKALLDLARLYHANRFYSEAQACYQLGAANSANLNARDHYHLADLALNQGNLAKAQDELRIVLSREPDYVPARLALGEALFKSGQETAAAQEYEAVVAMDPDQLQAGLGLARIELRRGDEDAAVARLEDLMAAHPESTTGAGLLAPVLRRRGDSERAEALVALSQQKPEPAPEDPWLTELLSDMYDIRLLGLRAEDFFRMGQIAAAQSLLNRIEELDSTSPVPSLLRGQADALAHRDESAVAHFRMALEKGGDPETVCPSMTKSFLALDRVGEAAEFFAEYHARFPDSVPIAKAYAEVLVKQEDNETAREVLAKVLELEPYLRAENMDLAQILWTAGDRDGAAACLQRVAATYSDDIPSRALLGEYYLGKADPVAAIPPLKQAFELAEPKTAVSENLSILLAAAFVQAGAKQAAQSNMAEAAAYFEEAIQTSPASAEAYAGLANASVALQDFGRAAEALEHLATLQPKNPTILLSLGDVVLRDGDPEKARLYWQRALDLTAPGDANLRRALESRLRGNFGGEVSP